MYETKNYECILREDVHYTHWALVMAYGIVELGHHCFRQWLGAIWHQAIAWINADLIINVNLSPVMCCSL